MTHLKQLKTKTLLKHLKAARKSKAFKIARKVLVVVLKITARILLKRLLDALLDGDLPFPEDRLRQRSNCQSNTYRDRANTWA